MAFYQYITFIRPDTQTPWWHDSGGEEVDTYRDVRSNSRVDLFHPEVEPTSVVSEDGLIRMLTVTFRDAQAFLNYRNSLKERDPEIYTKRWKFLVTTAQTMIIEWNEDPDEPRNLISKTIPGKTVEYGSKVLPGGLLID
jgi:hypothetical protein